MLCPWVAGMSEARSYNQDDSSCHSLELVQSGDSSVSEETQVGHVYRKVTQEAPEDV